MARTNTHDAARRGPALVLPTSLGFFLYDVGYHFARPVPTDLSSAQDVTQLAGQVVMTLTLLALARRHARDARALPALGIAATALCLLAELVIFVAPDSAGLAPAFLGTALSGLGFGACFVAWTFLLARSGGARTAGVGAVCALAASRAADSVLRHALPVDGWFPAGVVALDVSLALLVALVTLAIRRPGTSEAHPTASPQPVTARGREDAIVGLTGAALFSALFGLMTQVHNVSEGMSTLPDFVSCVVTLLALAPLAARLALAERPLGLGGLMLASLPVAAGVLIVVALMQSQVLAVADALIKTLFNVYFAATVAWVLPVARQRPALVCAAMLAVWGGVLAGSGVGFVVSSLTPFDAGSITAVALAAVWVCTLASTLVARRGPTGAIADEGAQAAAEPEVRYVDQTSRQVEGLARACGLSPREAEVVTLLARGRSAARIAGELTLSESTVKTHLQNAYAKAGVHSKQELLDKLSQS